ncbi:MAG: hypothetical protein ACI9FW_001013 [Flavobacterium sp.]|jgi:uncharacterized protein YegP (UPF0339 family)
MGTFVITKRINDLYKYEFVSRKGKPIFISKDFELRFECENKIEIIKEQIQECFFMQFKSTKGKFYFKIVLNEEEVAVSRKFSTQLMLQKSINEIIKYGNQSEVLDFSLELDIFKD